MGLSLGAYLAGVAELAAIAASLLFGAVRLRRRLLPGWSGAPARLAELVVAIAGLLWASELLGLLGILERWPLVALCAVAGIGVGALAGRGVPRAAGGDDGRTAPRVGAFQVAVAVAVAGALFAEWATPTLYSLNNGMYGFDTQWYHMPFAVRFAQTGEVWPLHYTAPVFLSWFYPANSELLHATGVLAFGRDLLSPVLNLGWLGLALLAAWCLGRPWGAPGWTVLGAGLVLGANVFGDQPGDARNDVVALALVLSATALLANARSVHAGPVVAIAALAAGLAMGTRLTALAPVAALTVGAIVLAPRAERLRAALAWLVPLLAAGGLWYLRNLVGSGNPLPWVDDVGPLSLPGPDQELGGREPFAVIHYATDTGVWSDWFFPALDDRLGPLWPALLAVAVAGALAAVVRGRGALRVLGAAAIAGGLAYLVTPVTASGPEGMPLGFPSNLRYLTTPLALGLGLVPIVWSLKSRRWLGRDWAWVAPLALGALFLSVVVDADRWPGVYLAPAIGAGVAVAVLASLWIASDVAPGASRRLRVAAVAVPVGAVVLGIAAGHPIQKRYLEERYSDPAELLSNPGLDTLFKWGRDVRDARIGTTIQRQLPLYGTDLSNHVQFVGVTGPAAAFERAASCEQWREAVNAGRYDYAITALDRIEPRGPTVPPERAWTRGDPAARPILSDGPATVWQLSGQLDPSACP